MREYIPTLIERRKWLKHRRNLAVNDLVLVVNPATPRGEWPLGRVQEVRADATGTVRSATVAVWSGKDTSTKLVERPVTKLALLEEVSEEEAGQTENVSEVQNRAGNVPNENGLPLTPSQME